MTDRDPLAVFVGDGPLRAEVERSLHALAAGPRPNAEVATYLAAADLFVLPSYSEGMPTVLVEAGAVGLPIVATTVGGIPELLAGGDRGVLVPPRDVAGLVEGIQRALADPAATERRSLKLREWVRERYDADRNAAVLIEKYAEAMRQ